MSLALGAAASLAVLVTATDAASTEERASWAKAIAGTSVAHRSEATVIRRGEMTVIFTVKRS
jgi:hypothetical protein